MLRLCEFRSEVLVPLVVAATLGLESLEASASCDPSRSQAVPAASNPVTDSSLYSAQQRMQAPASGAKSTACQSNGKASIVLSVGRAPIAAGYPWESALEEGSTSVKPTPPLHDENVTVTVERSDSVLIRLNARESRLGSRNALPFDSTKPSTFERPTGTVKQSSFSRPDVSARVKLFQVHEKRLSMDWGESSQGTEQGLTFSIDNPHMSSERLSIHGKVVRTDEGQRRYLVGLQRERLRMKHNSTLSFGVGDTGAGGLGARASWNLDSLTSDSGAAFGVALGDAGVHFALRIQQRF